MKLLSMLGSVFVKDAVSEHSMPCIFTGKKGLGTLVICPFLVWEACSFQLLFKSASISSNLREAHANHKRKCPGQLPAGLLFKPPLATVSRWASHTERS